jgi:hypothetical protein
VIPCWCRVAAPCRIAVPCQATNLSVTKVQHSESIGCEQVPLMLPLTTRQFARAVHAAASMAEIKKRVTPHTPRREALRLNYGSPFVAVKGLNPRSARAAHEAAPRCGNRK